ncbi:MAG: maleylpyruvate isomerase family mycothiol-dependent enzyme [Actinomycetota bacterium]
MGTAEWNAMNFAAKDNLLRIVREEAESFFALIDDPEIWLSPTSAGHWQVRDLVAHLVDTTEGYINRFEVTRSGQVAEGIAPLTEMSINADKFAQALHDIPREELIPRLHDAFSTAMKMFEQVTEEEWGTMMITHAYMGSLPAFFFPIGQLMDYGVHSWDIREGLEMNHFMTPDAADMLVPFMFVLWQATTDTSRLEGADLDVAVRVSGRNEGVTRIKVTQEGMAYEPGTVDGAQCVIDFDPASLVLTAFGRYRSGTPYGDQDAARRFASLFFRI